MRTQRNLTARFLTISVLLATALAGADDRIAVADFSRGVDAEGVPRGWQLKEKSGRAEFSVVKDGDLHALHLRSQNTSFSIQKSVKVDPAEHPVLSWKWKVTGLPEGGDFRNRKRDDQAAQLFLAFTKTKSIVYLWDTTAPEDLMGDAFAPPLMSIKVVVVRSGPAETGKWITETRNVLEDYRKLYGADENPPVVKGIRLQINSQHTGTSAESYFADVTFQKP